MGSVPLAEAAESNLNVECLCTSGTHLFVGGCRAKSLIERELFVNGKARASGGLLKNQLFFACKGCHDRTVARSRLCRAQRPSPDSDLHRLGKKFASA